MEKGGALHLNKLASTLPKDALCQVWLKLALWFLRRWKCEKFTPTTTTTTMTMTTNATTTTTTTTKDNVVKFWLEKLTWAFSSTILFIYIQYPSARHSWTLFEKVSGILYFWCYSTSIKSYLTPNVVIFHQQESHGPHLSLEKTVQINKHIWLS